MISRNIEQTRAVGTAIARRLKPGDIVCLTGDLGAGKTTLTQALLESLGIKAPITSPTYTIVNEYHDPIDVFHFDVYRVADIDEMEEIGFDDYLAQDAYVVIEWADRITPLIPREAIWVDLTYTGQDGEREIQVRGMEGFDETAEY